MVTHSWLMNGPPIPPSEVSAIYWDESEMSGVVAMCLVTKLQLVDNIYIFI